MEVNNKATREALEKIAHYDDSEYGMDDPYCKDGRICADIARKALAKPPRNCDVGTAREQSKRFDEFCFARRTMESCCDKCPVKDDPSCELAWAQMPYMEGGAK